MKAVQLLAYGDAVQGLEVREVAEPGRPGPGDALVATLYAPINVNDLMVAWGVYAWKPALPETLGNEGMGRVVSVGAGVTGVRAGDVVVLPFMSRTWRERLLVPAAQLVPLPDDADPQQAAMITINGATVAMLLDDFVPLWPGDAIVYNAATSGLGHWIAALARRRGLRSIGLVRSGGDVEKVRASGCDVVVVEGEDEAVTASRVAGFDVRLALDGVGGPAVEALTRRLGERGTLVAYGAASGKPMEVSAQHLIFKRIRVEGFFEGHPENVERIAPILHDLVGLIGPNGVAQPIARIYPLSRLREAVVHAVRGGKVLLSFTG